MLTRQTTLRVSQGDRVAVRPDQLIVIPLDPALVGAVAEVADALSLPLEQWQRGSGERMPRGVALVVAAGGGRERDGLDLLDDLPSTSVPVFLVGTTADRRVAVAAVHRGAQDYFSLPEDADLLRRAIERGMHRSRAEADAERFAAAEREAAGFSSILGQSPALTATL